MTYKAVLFDLDGTLLDTVEDLADAANAILQRRGIPTYTYKEYKTMIGGGIQNLMVHILGDAGKDEAQLKEAIAEWNGIYNAGWKNKTRPYPGVAQALDELSARGVRLTVLSNKPDHFTRQMVAELLAPWQFEIVRGLTPEFPPKPDPGSALSLAAGLGVAPHEFAYFGDSGIDMQTANAAGMYAVGVLWGFRSRAELLENGAQKLIERPEEIPAIFD